MTNKSMHTTLKETGIIIIQLVLTTFLILGIHLAFNGAHLAQVNQSGLCWETLVLNSVIFLSTYTSKRTMDECDAYLSMQ